MYIKGFDKDLRCRGMQFEVGKEYSTGAADADISLCTNTVFHFCDSLRKVHTYYSVIPKEDNRFCEIEVLGALVSNDTKCGSNRIRIVREILGDELNIMRGLTNGNAGIFNSGDYNSGNCNNGNRNSGNRNNGDCNSGDCNSGNRNGGNCNSGNWNSGNWNSGDWNSGNRNSGNCNSGNWNSGNWNSGDWNSGNRNSGDWNSGNWNSGDWNSGNWNNGCFNTVTNKIHLFNKPSNWTYQDWSLSVAKQTMDCVPSNLVWVEFAQMTDEEKESYPAAKATGGYLRKIPDDELTVIRNEWWARLSPDAKDEILKLPNFDGEIFKKITMIDVSNAAE